MKKWVDIAGIVLVGVLVGVGVWMMMGEGVKENRGRGAKPHRQARVPTVPKEDVARSRTGDPAPSQDVQEAEEEPARKKVIEKPKRVPRNPAVAKALASIGKPPVADMTVPDEDIAEQKRVQAEIARHYKTPLAAHLAQYAVPGRFTGTPEPFTDKEARAFCETPVETLAGDSEEIAAEKRAVAAMQEELKEYLANGGHANDYLMELMRRQDAEYEMLQSVKRDLRQLCRDGLLEDADRALDAYNKYLAERGLPPVKYTPDMLHYRRLHGAED